MKKLLFALAMSILFISCSTEDEKIDPFGGKITAADIEGVWTVTEFFTNDGKIKTKLSGVDVTANFKSEGKDFKNAKITFTQNPNIVVSTGTFTNTTTVSYLTFSQTEDSTESVPIVGDWSIANNIVSIGKGSKFLDYTIVEFKEGLLKLKYRYEENVEVISGVTGDATATINITVTK